MMIAYDTWDNPTNDPSILPTGYPRHIYEITEDMVERLQSEGYTVKSTTDFTAYKDSFDISAYTTFWAPPPFTFDEKKSMAHDIMADLDEVYDRNMDRIAQEQFGLSEVPAEQAALITKYLHWVDHFIDITNLDAFLAELDALSGAQYDTSFAPYVTPENLQALKQQVIDALTAKGLYPL